MAFIPAALQSVVAAQGKYPDLSVVMPLSRVPNPFEQANRFPGGVDCPYSGHVYTCFLVRISFQLRGTFHKLTSSVMVPISPNAHTAVGCL